MMRLRQGFAAGIVVVLAVVAVVAFVRGGDVESVPEAVTATTSTVTSLTTTTQATTTSTAEPTTSTTTDRVTEVEAILQDLAFRWFDAIYRKDPDALWEVVATEQGYDAGIAAFDSMTFTGAPSRDGTIVAVKEILLDRSDCLVVWHRLDVTAYRGAEATTEKVLVLWPDQRFGWRWATVWSGPGDLWRNDCDLVTRPVLP